jgi:hypothetical protein
MGITRGLYVKDNEHSNYIGVCEKDDNPTFRQMLKM